MENKVEKTMEKKSKKMKYASVQCEDKCNIHGTLSVRGRKFEGTVKKIVGQRAVIERESIINCPKYEMYARSRSKLHTHITKCMLPNIKVGDYVEIGECRPISKLTHFVLIRKIR